MTPIIQPITLATVPQYALQSASWINAVSTVQNLLRDRKTFIGNSGAILQSSVNVGTATTPTWTNLYTFPGGYAVNGFQELSNGEALVTTAGPGSVGYVYVSSGWSVNKATATWTRTLETIGGSIAGSYCVHDSASAADGTVLISESGSQTAGGSSNVTADITKARRVWKSKDFGLTWALIFDIYVYGQAQGIPYPAGLHVHGVSYDQDWGRDWICYGDNTGDGRSVAGTGFTQVVFSDDGGSTWQKLPNPPYYNNGVEPAKTLQMIVAVIFNNAVVFTTDLTDPKAPLVYPKTGYRQLGDPHCGPMYPSAVTGTVRKVMKDARFPVFFPGVVYATQTGQYTCRIPVTDNDGFTWSCINIDIPLQSPALTQMGFTQVLGPTLDGRVVLTGGMSINNDTTKKTMVADLVQL